MRGFTGLTLVLAGATAAFYGFYPESTDRMDALERAAAAFGGAPSTTAARTADLPLVVVDPQRRAFSPQAPLFQQLPRGDVGAGDTAQPKAAAASPSLVTKILPGPAAAQPAASASAPAAVNSVSPGPVTTVDAGTQADAAIAEMPRALSTVAVKSDGDSGKRDLTRNLQTELKRVGCYDGEITGTWTAASRRAMKSFTERVNATLPVDDPDYILLTLVQGHSGEACGANCPSGQVLAKDGKCLPRAIVAKAGTKIPKRPAAKPVDSQAPATVTTAKSPEVGRAIEMWAKVTPQATGSLAVKPSTSDGWKTAVIAAPPTPPLAPVMQPVAAAAPLPGRMAIGGPVAVQAPNAVTASIAAVEAQAAASGKSAAANRRIPRHVVSDDQPRPRRARSTDSGGSSYAPKPVRTTSKAARVRAMHYNLFSSPDRTTN